MKALMQLSWLQDAAELRDEESVAATKTRWRKWKAIIDRDLKVSEPLAHQLQPRKQAVFIF